MISKTSILFVFVTTVRTSRGLWRHQISQIRYRNVHQRRSSQSTESATPVLRHEEMVISFAEWQLKAEAHKTIIENLLYPPHTSPVNLPADKKLRRRSHLVSEHPIYSFLHNYYQYSVCKLKYYSPGVGAVLEGAKPALHGKELDLKYMSYSDLGGEYDQNKVVTYIKSRNFGWDRIIKARNILKAAFRKPAFFGCFGMHEWAMLYSGNGTTVKGHQHHLPMRVDQNTIDTVVGAPGQMRCTHFDAYRFFQPGAKPLNAVSQLTRETQVRYEQPGCIHANMDLFKYAYMAYPAVSSELLVQALELALEARKVDMRASPYDVSSFAGCEIPICVETVAGRKLYVEEQERVARLAVPVRRRLLDVYDRLIEHDSSINSNCENALNNSIYE